MPLFIFSWTFTGFDSRAVSSMRICSSLCTAVVRL